MRIIAQQLRPATIILPRNYQGYSIARGPRLADSITTCRYYHFKSAAALRFQRLRRQAVNDFGAKLRTALCGESALEQWRDTSDVTVPAYAFAEHELVAPRQVFQYCVNYELRDRRGLSKVMIVLQTVVYDAKHYVVVPLLVLRYEGTSIRQEPQMSGSYERYSSECRPQRFLRFDIVVVFEHEQAFSKNFFRNPSGAELVQKMFWLDQGPVCGDS